MRSAPTSCRPPTASPRDSATGGPTSRAERRPPTARGAGAPADGPLARRVLSGAGMPLLPHASRTTGLLCGALLTVGLSACGSAVSTGGFKGEQHAVAQTISNLQSDATATDQKKICANDLAGAVVSRLGGTKGCEQAIKNQLAEIDSLEVKIQSITLGA